MSPNNETLLNAVLRPKLLNNTFASCLFMNLDFLLPHTAHFDDNIGLPFLVLTLLNLYFLYFFLAL